jgi:heme oxygenase (biliverdin-IX-beta and delta-forming)
MQTHVGRANRGIDASGVSMSNRFALRDLTQADHAELDSAASRLDLGRDDDYKTFLSWHARLVPGIEMQLEDAGVADIVPEWGKRVRRHALAADISALSLDPAPADIGQLPREPAAVWGMSYVLEGSRLGNQMLMRMVSPHLRAKATRYLAHGRDERLWPSFASAIDAIAFSPVERELAGAAARRVFGLFSKTLPAQTTTGRYATSG